MERNSSSLPLFETHDVFGTEKMRNLVIVAWNSNSRYFSSRLRRIVKALHYQTLQQAKTLRQLKQAYQPQETKHEDGSTNPVHVPGRNDRESQFATIGLVEIRNHRLSRNLKGAVTFVNMLNTHR